jgi:Leucine Rich repeat
MFATNLIFFSGKIKLFQNINKIGWADKVGVLIQSDLVIFNSNFTDEKEDGKIKMAGIQCSICQDNAEWQVDLIRNNTKNSFRVETQKLAEKWHKMITFASCWSNYEHFCELQHLKPWINLLRWAARGNSSLAINLKSCNNFAISEFLRENIYIKELIIQELNNEVPVLCRILYCFNKGQLQLLDLSYSGLDNSSLVSLKKALGQHNSLLNLNLSNNLLTSLAVNNLIKILVKMPLLKYLSLAGNKISDEGLAALVPDVFSYAPLENLSLSRCDITDSSTYFICRLIKIKNLNLKVFDISYNKISIESTKYILEKIARNGHKSNFQLLIFPLCIDQDIIKYIESGDYFLKKSSTNKSAPKVVKHRETIDKISNKINTINENVYVEDLVDLIKELSYLDFQFPRIRLEKIEKIAMDYLSYAVSQPNYYCLELLVPVLNKVGIHHLQAEETLNILAPEVDHILNTLVNVLSPELYTEENLPEINSLLDSVLKRCDELCIRGEIVYVAKLLRNKRDEFLKKNKSNKV